MRAVDAVICRGEPVARAQAPRVDEAIDGARIEVRTVCEDDDRRLSVATKCREPAAKRCARASSPVLALHDARGRLDLVRTGHDDDVFDALLERR